MLSRGCGHNWNIQTGSSLLKNVVKFIYFAMFPKYENCMIEEVTSNEVEEVLQLGSESAVRNIMITSY
jgi:hypothetical protein